MNNQENNMLPRPDNDQDANDRMVDNPDGPTNRGVGAPAPSQFGVQSILQPCFAHAVRVAKSTLPQ